MQSVGPYFEVYAHVVISKAAHILLGHGFFLLQAVLKSKLVIVEALFELRDSAFGLLNHTWAWFFYLLVVHFLHNLFLGALYLKSLHDGHLLRLVLFLVMLVLVSTFRLLMMHHNLLFRKILPYFVDNLMHVLAGLV